MRLHKRYIGIIFFAFITLTGLAQNTGFYWTQLNDSSNRLQGKLMGKVYYITALANSHFLYPDEWRNGSVTLKDGDKYENMKLRYHIFEDELIAYNNNTNALYFVEKELVQSFTFEEDGATRNFLKLSKTKGNKKQQYYEELYSGTLSLVAFRYMYEHKVSPYLDKLGVMRDTEYRLQMEFYLYSENRPPQKILPNRRAFLNTFPEHKKEIKKLLRINGLYIKEQQSMIQAFRILDEAGLLQ
jgi:hypothetical protein